MILKDARFLIPYTGMWCNLGLLEGGKFKFFVNNVTNTYVHGLDEDGVDLSIHINDLEYLEFGGNCNV
jgi:hypothetical protein